MAEQCIATAEALRSGEWLVRRAAVGFVIPEGSNTIHADREEARHALMAWARRHAWAVDRYPYGANPIAKHLRKRP